MIFRIREYVIHPDKFEVFNTLFYECLLPNQIKFGATLVVRLINNNRTRILAIWSYLDERHYDSVEEKIIESNLHREAQKFKYKHEPLYKETTQTFWRSTADFYRKGS